MLEARVRPIYRLSHYRTPCFVKAKKELGQPYYSCRYRVRITDAGGMNQFAIANSLVDHEVSVYAIAAVVHFNEHSELQVFVKFGKKKTPCFVKNLFKEFGITVEIMPLIGRSLKYNVAFLKKDGDFEEAFASNIN